MKRTVLRWLKALITPAMAGLAATVAAVAIVAANPTLFAAANLGVFDQFQRMAPRAPLADSPVRVLVIDTESLEKRGQWPWPRVDMAELVGTLRELGAASIAFDVVFAEPDRTSPQRIAKRYERRNAKLADALKGVADTDYDRAFAREIGQSPVVLGAFLSPLGKAPAQPVAPRFPASVSFVGDSPVASITRFDQVEGNLPELTRAAQAIGSVSLSTRRGGLIRRVPLFSRVDERIAPALSIEALRIALQQRGYLIRSSTASGEISGGVDPVVVDSRLGPFVIPLTEAGEFWVRFASGPSAPVLPIWRFLDENADREALRAEVEGRIIFIGASAPGLRDLVATPIEDQTLGVSVHAEIVEQIVSGEFLLRPDWASGAEVTVTALSGLAVTLSVALLGPMAGALLTLAALGAVGYGTWISFAEYDLLIAPVGPALGALAPAIVAGTWRYAQSEAQRRTVRQQFEHFVSAEVVEEIAADPSRYLTPRGEVRELTLLFADIHGFSRMSEGLDPETLIGLLNDVLTPMAEAVIDEGGTVDKFMGDAMMAFWNAPRPAPDHPEKALAAALRLQRDLIAVNARFEAEGHPRFEVGVGMNTGQCSVGPMGSRRRLDYSCIGDPVNLASRLEGITRQYRAPICVGQETATRVSHDAFALLELDRIRVHGRDAPERVFALLGAEDVAKHPSFHALKQDYGRALSAYRSRDWDRALAGFRAASRHATPGFDPKPLCAMFEARTAAFQARPPEADWDGVHQAAVK